MRWSRELYMSSKTYHTNGSVDTMILLLVLLQFGSVHGLRSWTLRNINVRETNPKDEEKLFYPSNPAIRILDEAMCRDQSKPVTLRVIPLKDLLVVVENDLEESAIKKLQPCHTNRTMGEPKCGVCWQEHCDSNITIPCKSPMQVSKWESTLLLDITVDRGIITKCWAMCRDIGYYEDDTYRGGNGISMVGIGIMITVLLIIGLVAMLSVNFLKTACVKDMKEEEYPYPTKSTPLEKVRSHPYPTKSREYPFIKKEGRMVEF